MFHVGAARYSVRVTDGPIVHDGSRCLGLCDAERRVVLISGEAPIDQRLHILLHELAHAHAYAVGMPRDAESTCDFLATVAELAFRDLASAGGEEALKRLRPGEELGQMTGRIGLLRARHCRCGGQIPPGEVWCRQDRERPDQVKLSIYCEHCDLTISWNELATFGGLPGGVVVDEPTIEHGRAFTLPAA